MTSGKNVEKDMEGAETGEESVRESLTIEDSSPIFSILALLADDEFFAESEDGKKITHKGMRAIDIAKMLKKSKAAITRQINIMAEKNLLRFDSTKRKNRLIRINWNKIYALLIKSFDYDYNDKYVVYEDKEERKIIHEFMKNRKEIFSNRMMKNFILTYLKDVIADYFKTADITLSDIFDGFHNYMFYSGVNFFYPIIKEDLLKKLLPDEQILIKNLILLHLVSSPTVGSEENTNAIIESMFIEKNIDFENMLFKAKKELRDYYLSLMENESGGDKHKVKVDDR